ncbi:MAG: hypothetical protein LBT13_01995, partial [Treponema sp.]|nr:hypothetical protein [Treponema sp.]
RSFTDIYLKLQIENNIVESYIFNSETENRLVQGITRLYPVQRISQNMLASLINGNQVEIEDFILQIPKETLSTINEFSKKIIRFLPYYCLLMYILLKSKDC